MENVMQLSKIYIASDFQNVPRWPQSRPGLPGKRVPSYNAIAALLAFPPAPTLTLCSSAPFQITL